MSEYLLKNEQGILKLEGDFLDIYENEISGKKEFFLVGMCPIPESKLWRLLGR